MRPNFLRAMILGVVVDIIICSIYNAEEKEEEVVAANCEV